MPIKPENKSRYPRNWKEIRGAILERAQSLCEFCSARNYEPHPITRKRVILTIAHLDHIPENCDHANLKALCQRCHNRYDGPHRAANRRKTLELKRLPKLEGC
jgi:5-methylcytosine-specific restriction endonuclease McrA